MCIDESPEASAKEPTPSDLERIATYAEQLFMACHRATRTSPVTSQPDWTPAIDKLNVATARKLRTFVLTGTRLRVSPQRRSHPWNNGRMRSTRALRRQMFDDGYVAFSRRFPNAAEHAAGEKFYVCPLCLVAYREAALDSDVLTLDHSPPKSLGGKTLVLTCRQCNSKAGHDLEIHARREHDWIDFHHGNLTERKATLITSSGELPMRLTVENFTMKMVGVDAVNPATRESVIEGLNEATTPEGAANFKFSIRLDHAYSPKAASTTYLKAAYLCFFAALGYSFIYRPELDIVRKRLSDTEEERPKIFRLIQPKLDPTLYRLLRADAPDHFKCFAMFYGKFVVFLPRFNDLTFYERLEDKQDAKEQLSGVVFPWPRVPVFRWDHMIAESRGVTA